MIRGICRTNRDDYKNEQWPENFVAVPQKGDLVESRSGKVLQVLRITHCHTFRGKLTKMNWSEPTSPYIKIELGKIQ